MTDRAPPPDDSRLCSPSVERNSAPLLNALAKVLPSAGRVLEVACGSGEHARAAAARFPNLTWRPSDPDPTARASAAAWRAEAGLETLLEPIALNAADKDWGVAAAEAPYAAVVCVNMIHIAPWRACEGLIAGAARVLADDGVLVLYGPYRRFGAHTAPSNAEFDASLKARNPEWGVRDLEAVEALAAQAGFGPVRVIAMPANNFTVAFARASA